MALDTGALLGPYEILARTGAGGMGEVYRARDSVWPDEHQARRFEQEARAAGLLNHPNILVASDIGTHDGPPYTKFS